MDEIIFPMFLCTGFSNSTNLSLFVNKASTLYNGGGETLGWGSLLDISSVVTGGRGPET